jgi:hypothetical protein
LDPTPTLEASQAATAVPAMNFRSAFADLPQGVEATVLDWKAANAQVGQFRRGHADLLKWELEQASRRNPNRGVSHESSPVSLCFAAVRRSELGRPR